MKKNIFILLFLFGGFIQKPVAQTFPWADSGKGNIFPLYSNPTATGFGICTDDSGNVFAIGDITYLSNSFLNKYDNSGHLLWTKSESNGYGVTTDNWGNCYVAGAYFFEKYSRNGLLIRRDSVTGLVARSVSSNAICYDGEKYLYITGSWGGDYDSVIFGTQELITGPNSGTSELFILKCDTAGNVIWAKTSNSSSSGQCGGFGINVATNKLIYVTGYFAEDALLGGDSLNTSLTNPVAFVACFDTNGNVQWANSTNRYISWGYSVSSDGAGNAYITGSTNGNCFIAKYKSNGDSVWWRQCNSGVDQENSWGFGISTNYSGISFITGGYEGAPFGSLYLHGDGGTTDIFMVKYDSSGNAIWGYDPNDTLPNSVPNFGLAVSTDNEGCNFYFTGVTATPAIFSNTIIYSGSYVTKLDSGCTLVAGIRNTVFSKETIKVYPNPFTNSTTILFNKSEKHILVVEDMTGRILAQFECSGPQYELSRGSLANGMYFIKVTDEQNNVFVSKILVQ